MYPVSYAADYAAEGRNRLTTFFRSIVAIPWLVVAYFYGIAASIVVVIAWFAILFTGKHPEGLFGPARSASAYLTRASAYFLLISEDWPPFSLEDGAAATAGELQSEAASRTS